MPKIPQSEVRDSDFGDLATADQAALAEAAEKSRALAHYSAQAAKASEMFKDAPRAGYEGGTMSETSTDPAPSTVSGVRVWGVEWTCSFTSDGRLRQVRVGRSWGDAESFLSEELCEAIERAYAEMPA